MSWVHVKDGYPEPTDDVFYFFEVLGMYRGKYMESPYPEEFGLDDEGKPFVGHCFYGDKGFLTDDVTHWMIADDYEEGEMPDLPDEYVQVEDGHFNGYTHRDNAIVVRKDDYEGLKNRLDYLLEGHLEGLVCQDGCPIHIYWKEEYNGYHCGGCGTVYPTEEVEGNPDKYKESTYVYEGETE